MCIDDIVSYESENENDLQKEFEASVDNYLDTCKQVNRQPDNPFGLKGRKVDEKDRAPFLPFKNRTPGGPEGFGKYIPPGPGRDNIRLIPHPLLDEKPAEIKELHEQVDKSVIDPDFVFSSPHDWNELLKKSNSIPDYEAQLAELIKSFTPEEKVQYDLACGMLADILDEETRSQVETLEKQGWNVSGIHIAENGDKLMASIALSNSISAAQKIADDIEKEGND